MAIPDGCRTVCRPVRTTARRFNAEAVGRAACAAKNAGESDEAILSEVLRCVRAEVSDCEEVRLAVFAAMDALALIAVVAASRSKANKLAKEELEALMARLRSASGQPKTGTLQTLEVLDNWFILSAQVDETVQEELDRITDMLRISTVSAGNGAGVVIKP